MCKSWELGKEQRVAQKNNSTKWHTCRMDWDALCFPSRLFLQITLALCLPTVIVNSFFWWRSVFTSYLMCISPRPKFLKAC